MTLPTARTTLTFPQRTVALKSMQDMLSSLRKFLKSLPAMRGPSVKDPAPVALPLHPETAFYAIGDVHGRADLIEPLLNRIDADLVAQGHAAAQLVFVGDYVDRGDHSAEVLEHLVTLSRDLPDAVTCLMGNHERMMLDFIDDPAGRGARWLANGGLQTLASYQIGGLSPRASLEEMSEASDALAAALPEGTEAWLRALPFSWKSGNVICVHAAMNPAKPPEDQSERTLLWGHKDFAGTPRSDDLWVVHGHTIVKEPVAKAGRISIDTGAYHSNRLTVAAISEGSCRFL